MKKIFLILSLLTISVFAATASAKESCYRVMAGLYEGDDAGIEKIRYSLAEIAKAAGFDSPQAMQEAMQSRHIFWGQDTIGGGELTDDFTHYNKGFYFCADGCVVPKDYKSHSFTPFFYCYFRADVENDEFACYIGQVSDKCKAGDVFCTSVFLVNGDNTVEFNIVLGIKEDTAVLLPPSSSQISKLKVTGETDVHVTITDKSPGYIRVGIKDVAEDYGVDMDSPKMIEKILYSCGSNNSTSEVMDELIAYARYNTLYFKTDDLSGETICPCGATSAYYSDCFIINNLYYDKSSGEIVATVRPYESEIGRKYKAELYIIYGSKAYQINVFIDVSDHQLKKMEEYTCVGKSSLAIEMTTRGLDGISYIDVDLIAEKLHCQKSEIVFLVLDDEGYVNGDFVPSSWGSCYPITTKGTLCKQNDFCYNACYKVDKSQIVIRRLLSNKLPVGDSVMYKTLLLFAYDDKLYEVEFAITFVSYLVEIDDGEEAGSESLYAQLLDEGNNYKSECLWIVRSKIIDLIGESELGWMLCTYKHSEAVDEGRGVMTNKCDEWTDFQRVQMILDADGYVVPDSVSKLEENVQYLHITSRLSDQVGYIYINFGLDNSNNTIYSGSVFIVNMENKKYYTVNYIIEPVQNIKNVEYVGEEEILLPVSTDGIMYTEFDPGKAMDALGMEGWHPSSKVEWLANRSNKADFLYINDEYCEDLGGFPLDKDGCKMSKYEDVAFYVGYANEGDKHYFTSSAAAVPEDGQEYATRLALDYGNNRYVFRIRLMNEKTYTTVRGVNAEQRLDDGIIYDLCGKVVGRDGKSVGGLAKGIYIRDGKKFVVR